LNIFFFGAMFGLFGQWRRIELARSWQTTTGTVVAVDRGNHLSITARYFVNHKQFEQTLAPSYKTVGDAVVVYYLPSDPNVAGIENPRDWLDNTLRVFLIGTIMMSAFVAVMIRVPAVGQALSWPWSGFRIRPRFAMIWIAIAVLVGSVVPLFAGAVSGRLLLADGLVLGGTALLCRRAFQLPYEASWRIFARSRTVLLAVALLIAAQLVNSLATD